MGDRLLPDGSLCLGAHHPVSSAGPTLPKQRQLRGDYRRVLAGPAPHQVTERKWAGGQGERAGGQRGQPIRSSGERGEARPAPNSDTRL